MSDLIKDTILATLGVLSLTREKAETLFKDLVKKGELAETEEAKFVKNVIEKSGKRRVEVEKKIEEIVERAVKKLNVPTRKDLEEIKDKLDELIKK
jgi:polyhydroxyalkanoate synthesis regulator phasin